MSEHILPRANLAENTLLEFISNTQATTLGVLESEICEQVKSIQLNFLYFNTLDSIVASVGEYKSNFLPRAFRLTGSISHNNFTAQISNSTVLSDRYIFDILPLKKLNNCLDSRS